MFKKMTKLERAWVLYDVGNSIFTMMVSTLIPIWFKSLAAESAMDSSTYLADWSYAVDLSGGLELRCQRGHNYCGSSRADSRGHFGS